MIIKKLDKLCLLTLNFRGSFIFLCLCYMGVILILLISLNIGFSTEVKLPIKELAELNIALEVVEKEVVALESQISKNSEDKQSHKLAYFILGVIAIIVVIKGLKLESIFGSSPNVASKVPAPNMSPISDQPAEAAVSSTLQVIANKETSMVCFQPIDLQNIDTASLAVIPKKGIYPVIDHFICIDSWLQNITGWCFINTRIPVNLNSNRVGGLFRYPASSNDGLRNKLILPNDMERFLSSSRNVNSE